MTRPSNYVQTRVAIVMTVFNRRDTTLRCLESIAAQDNDANRCTVYVVDDASTDGTGQAIAAQFPEVRLIAGDGQLYWNGGMGLALDEAYRDGHDFYWWLNDDVELESDALDRLLEVAAARAHSGERPSIVVGSLRDPDDGSLTYGGVTRLDPLRRMVFSLVTPEEDPVPAETMNGNCVLVPGTIAEVVGNVTPEYRQKMGDYDYGLMAGEAGFGVVVAPGTFGTCARHDERPEDSSQPLSALWSVKELPFRAWWLFCRRWGGPFWPLYFVSPYAKRGTRILVGRLRSWWK